MVTRADSLLGNLSPYRQLRAVQKVYRLLDPIEIQVAHGRMMGQRPEQPAEVFGVHTKWFAKSAKEASCATGQHMVECTLEWLRSWDG